MVGAPILPGAAVGSSIAFPCESLSGFLRPFGADGKAMEEHGSL